MIRILWFFMLVPLSFGQEDYFCNICGEGNQINFPTGVVEFFYDGLMRKNNCNTWQKTVQNPNAISKEFCQNEILKYTHKVCRCTDKVGTSVEWSPPTAAPTDAPTFEGGGSSSVSSCLSADGSPCDGQSGSDSLIASVSLGFGLALVSISLLLA